MTVDQLRGYINTGVSLGSMLAVFLPDQEWDDRILDYMRAFAASDALLELIADDLTNNDGPFMASGQTVVMRAANGSEQAIDPATIMVIIKLVMTIRELIKKRREQ